MLVSGRFLLDSSIIVLLLRGEPGIEVRLLQIDEVYLSSTSLGELFYGARKSVRVADNLAAIHNFIVGRTILPCDVATAQEYGIIKNELRTKGKPLPENDIWIAATARQYDLTLATRDAHLSEIVDLKQELW